VARGLTAVLVIENKAAVVVDRSPSRRSSWLGAIFLDVTNIETRQTSTAVESVSNPYGRSCSVCGGGDRQAIDTALSLGTSVTLLSRQFGVGRDSVYRHLRFHLRPAMKAAMKEAPASRPSALVVRIADVADSARDARVQAYSTGDAALGARLGDAEVRALQVLIERFKIDHDDTTAELRDASALADALTELMPRAPKLAEVLADLLDRRERPDLAERVRQLPQHRVSGNERPQELSHADH
jgi:hypothetical protein